MLFSKYTHLPRDIIKPHIKNNSSLKPFFPSEIVFVIVWKKEIPYSLTTFWAHPNQWEVVCFLITTTSCQQFATKQERNKLLITFLKTNTLVYKKFPFLLQKHYFFSMAEKSREWKKYWFQSFATFLLPSILTANLFQQKLLEQLPKSGKRQLCHKKWLFRSKIKHDSFYIFIEEHMKPNMIHIR